MSIRLLLMSYQRLDSSWFKNALYIVDGGSGAFGDEAKKDQIDPYLSGLHNNQGLPG